MSETFTNKLTIKGQQKKAVAEANNTGLNITTFQVGDGNGAYYEPTENQTALKNTKYTGTFTAGTQSQIIINPSATNEVLYKCFIPADVGGFTIRELGLFDNDGDLILICKLPAQDKFSLSSGLYQPLTFTPKIIYTNPTTSAVLTPTSQIVPTTREVISLIEEYTPESNYSSPLINNDGTVSLEIDETLTILNDKLSVATDTFVKKDGSVSFTAEQEGVDATTNAGLTTLQQVLALVNEVLPTQTGNNGQVLTTNGTDASWGDVNLGDKISFSAINVYSSTLSTTFTDLDLSAYAGANRSLVILKVRPSAVLDFKSRTNEDTLNVAYTNTCWYGGGVSAATIQAGYESFIIVPTDENGIIEIACGQASGGTVAIDLMGYINNG